MDVINKHKIIISGLYYGFMLLVNLLMFRSPDLLAVILFACGIIGWKWIFTYHQKKQYVIGALAGFCGEMLSVWLGIWKYQHTGVFFVPIWLPFAWGNAIVCVDWIAGLIKGGKGK